MKILVLDDDLNVLNAILNTVRALGYEAIGFQEHQDFAHHLTQSSEVDVLIVDQMLESKLSGIEVVRLLISEYQVNIPTVLVTGYSSPELESQVREQLNMCLLAKPFSLAQMQEALEGIKACPDTTKQA